MKNFIYGIVVLGFASACDYSTSSNGNIDAAFARETDQNKKEESIHGSTNHHGAEKPKEHFPADAYDTTAQEHKQAPEGQVIATDTVPLGKKGQGDH